MHVIEAASFFIHSPSIPMTLKDTVNGSSHSDAGGGGVVFLPPPILSDHTTIDPGHKAILEMHENSESTALFYVGVVLVLYIIALIAVLSKYRRSERYENRLTRLYDDFMRRDRYLHRIPKRVVASEIPLAKDSNDKQKQPDYVIKAEGECNV